MLLYNRTDFCIYNGNKSTLKEETFPEETFAISRFSAKFAKVCSREIFVIYKSRKFILAKKKQL